MQNCPSLATVLESGMTPSAFPIPVCTLSKISVRRWRWRRWRWRWSWSWRSGWSWRWWEKASMRGGRRWLHWTGRDAAAATLQRPYGEHADEGTEERDDTDARQQQPHPGAWPWLPAERHRNRETTLSAPRKIPRVLVARCPCSLWLHGVPAHRRQRLHSRPAAQEV